VWLARQDIAKKGFTPSTRQIAVFEQQPTEEQADKVRASCVKFQEEMYEFGESRPREFAGTFSALISEYQTDKDSPYRAARFTTRKSLDFHAKQIDKLIGQKKLADIGARDFKELHENIRWPDGKEGRERISSAHHAMTTLRMMISFGATFEVEKAPRDRISECARLSGILSKMTFQNSKSRSETLSLRQAEDIIAAANAAGLSSIALTQALQRSLALRQKDVIGEWVPVSEPGVSEIIFHGRKWLRGLRWEEISSDMILTHTMSKSRQGKVVEFDLKLYPLVLAELAKIPQEDRHGPIVICEITGRPWKQNHFLLRWRDMATKAKVPKNVQNRDSRAGSITEIIEATNGNLEAARKQAGHSDVKTTQGYSRDALKSNSETAVIVADFRAKNGR